MSRSQTAPAEGPLLADPYPRRSLGRVPDALQAILIAICTHGGYAQRYNSVNTLQRKAIEFAKFTLSLFTSINCLPDELLQHSLI
jgi:hypothetical protein